MEAWARLRPGIYADYASSRIYETGQQGAAALVAVASGGPRQEVIRLTRAGEAAECFGADTGTAVLCAMAELLLANGAGQVLAVAPACSGEPVTSSDYEAAFALLAGESAPVMVTDAAGEAVLQSAGTMLAALARRGEERILFAGAQSNAQAVDLAAALNRERIVLAGGKAEHAGYAAQSCFLAAALAGAVCALPVTGEALNGLALQGIDRLAETLSEAEIDALIAAGVTPLEQRGGRVRVIRAVTTRTKSGETPDASFRELSTVLTADAVIRAVRTALQARLAASRNHGLTRNAIATAAALELAMQREAGRIESFSPPEAAADPEDATRCLLALRFTVARALNQIRIAATITL